MISNMVERNKTKHTDNLKLLTSSVYLISSQIYPTLAAVFMHRGEYINSTSKRKKMAIKVIKDKIIILQEKKSKNFSETNTKMFAINAGVN